MNYLAQAHCRLLRNDRGAAMIEYALLVAAVVAAGTVILGDATIATSLMGRIQLFVDGIADL